MRKAYLRYVYIFHSMLCLHARTLYEMAGPDCVGIWNHTSFMALRVQLIWLIFVKICVYKIQSLFWMQSCHHVSLRLTTKNVVCHMMYLHFKSITTQPSPQVHTPSTTHRHLTGISAMFTHHDDDVIKWKHFLRNWPFVRGIHRSRWIQHTKASDAELWWVFYLGLNKRLNKQPWGWCFETQSWSLWRHCNDGRGIPVQVHMCVMTHFCFIICSGWSIILLKLFALLDDSRLRRSTAG